MLIFQASKMVFLNSRTSHDFPEPVVTLVGCLVSCILAIQITFTVRLTDIKGKVKSAMPLRSVGGVLISLSRPLSP